MERVHADRQRILALLSDLIRIDSVNPALEGATVGEGPIARYVADLCRGLGLETTLQEVEPGRPNVLARLRGGGSRHTLLLEAHLDTVTLANMPHGLEPRLEGDRLYGRGACDTKGGLAAMLGALELLAPRARALPCDVLFLGSMGEEVDGKGASYFATTGGRADGAVVAEPSSLRPIVAHKGVARFRIKTTGRSGHSSRPELGDNAIEQMAEVIRFLKETVEPRLAQLRHPLCGPATQCLARIYGGVQINIVPHEAYLEIDRRVLPTEEPEAVLDSYRAALAELRRQRPGVRAEVDRVFLLSPGMEAGLDSAIVQATLAACQAVVGRAEPAGVPYGTDASWLWKQGGIPCVVLGPGSIDQAHTADEWVPLDEVVRAVELYAEIAARFGA